jgi:hypothetical protein
MSSLVQNSWARVGNFTSGYRNDTIATIVSTLVDVLRVQRKTA